MFFVAEDIGQYSFIIVAIITDNLDIFRLFFFIKTVRNFFFSSLIFFVIPKFGMVSGLS